MQLACVLYWSPPGVLGCHQNLGRCLDFGEIRAHGFNDGDDLVRMDAALISHLARTISGCSNCPGLFIALPGMAP